ncbi:hypothetical protein BJX99DRAFT_262447 [Aspergillus californicus]
MADPVSIIGTAGALVNVIQVISQTILAIRDLRGDWKDADLTFLSLTSQLTALRLALTKIQEWLSLETGDLHHQLVMDLDESINCCIVLLTKLQDAVDSLRQKQNHALDLQSKVKLVFGKKSIDDIQKLLEHQTNALTLLLTACNCKTGAEQKALLLRTSSRRIFRQLNADTASLMVHRDTSSIATHFTDNMSKLSVAFSFDPQLFISGVYERFFRGLTKRVWGNPQIDNTPVVEDRQKPPLFAQCLLIFSRDAWTVVNILQEMVGEYGPQTIDPDLVLQRTAVYKFVITRTREIITALNHEGSGPELGINAAHFNFLVGYAGSLSTIRPLDEGVVMAIRSLWQDPCMERVRKFPRYFGIAEAALELLDDIDRIALPDYQPTRHSAAEAGSPKVTLVYSIFLDDTLYFASKVPYDFEDVRTIIMLIDLAGYDQYPTSNASQTSLYQWTSECEAMLRSAWLPNDSRVVVIDSAPKQFVSQLATHVFAEYFPGYEGENEPHAIASFLIMRFKRLRPEQVILGADVKTIDTCPGNTRIEKLLLFSDCLWSMDKYGFRFEKA